MANLEDLDILSVTDMQNDEAVELLRQIRLSRRMPVKKLRRSPKRRHNQRINAAQAAEILKILEGDKCLT